MTAFRVSILVISNVGHHLTIADIMCCLTSPAFCNNNKRNLTCQVPLQLTYSSSKVFNFLRYRSKNIEPAQMNTQKIRDNINDQ